MEFAVLKAHLLYYGKQAVTAIWAKCGFALVYAAMLPHQMAIQGLAILFAADFVCGVCVAKKARRVSSAGMRRGVAKLLIYFVFLAMVATAESTIFKTDFCTIAAIGVLAGTELLSITENLVMLGLPIPFASKVLRIVANKAANYGIVVSDDPQALALGRDLITMLDKTVPSVKDPTLRTCLGVYLSHWYQFVHDAQSSDFSGSGDLTLARTRATMDRVLIEVHDGLTREGIDQAAQTTFLNQWNSGLIRALYTRVSEICQQETGDPDAKVGQLRDAVVLAMFKLLRDSQVLDVKPEPLKLYPTHRIGIDELPKAAA